MEILVLNGSPKGEISVTMQYVKFLQNNFPEHNFTIRHISFRISKISKDRKLFNLIMKEVENSDLILWSFPVYVMTVPSQYKKFIELIFARRKQKFFSGKYCGVLTTSIHFYDHTAHNYLRAVCEDLNLKFVDSYSAHMRDLFKKEKRKSLKFFGQNLVNAVLNEKPATKIFPELIKPKLRYNPKFNHKKIENAGKNIVILTDNYVKNRNLKNMIDKFKSIYEIEPPVYDLSKMDIKGGCIGCIKCGYDNICSYDGKDEYVEFYNEKLRTADIIIFAGTIVDRHLSSTWVTYFTRSFFNCHTPSLENKQFGFLISGPFSKTQNLRQVLDSYIQWQNSNLVDFISDEYESSKIMDSLIWELGEKLISFSKENYIKPATFLAVGGKKIFRDDIYGSLRPAFLADHREYKKRGLYDFPTWDLKTRFINMIIPQFLKIPAIRKRVFDKEIKPGMIRGYDKVIKKIE
jgi:multimeric flavodoxin WrbA